MIRCFYREVRELEITARAWGSLVFTGNADEHTSRQLHRRRATRGTQLPFLGAIQDFFPQMLQSFSRALI